MEDNNCVPQPINPLPDRQEMFFELARARRKISNQKKALRNANKLIQDLQIRLSNQSWKSKMWEMRALRLGFPHKKEARRWWHLF